MIETIFYICSIAVIIVLIVCTLDTMIYNIKKRKPTVITYGDYVITLKNDLGVEKGTTGYVENKFRKNYIIIKTKNGKTYAVHKYNIRKIEEDI